MKQVKLTIEVVYDIQQDMPGDILAMEMQQVKDIFIQVPYASYFTPFTVNKKTEIVEGQ